MYRNILMKNTIIVDTGFWYALLNQEDHFHNRAITALEQLNSTLICTWPVITETSYFLQSRMGQKQACEILAAYNDGLYEVYNLTTNDSLRIVELMHKYADLPMDLADASLVILAEELGHGRILSTDMRNFKTYRWKNHKPFQNLLLPDS